MPHAAIYWCNKVRHRREYERNQVSMPHAAIYWCNEIEVTTTIDSALFQCRTRQFTGAMSNSQDELYLG